MSTIAKHSQPILFIHDWASFCFIPFKNGNWVGSKVSACEFSLCPRLAEGWKFGWYFCLIGQRCACLMVFSHQPIQPRGDKMGAGKFCLALGWGVWSLGPFLHAYITKQAPGGGPGPGTMASAVRVLPPNTPPLSFPSITWIPWFFPVCSSAHGAFLSTLTVSARGVTPGWWWGWTRDRLFTIILNFLGFVSVSQTLNAILMQLFCVWIICSFCQTSSPGTKIS